MTFRTLLCTLIALSLITTPGAAQDKKRSKKNRGRPYYPKLANDKGKSFKDIPLGPLSAVARVPFKGTECTIQGLDPQGLAARAGLEIGDRIVAVGGLQFPTYQRKNSTGDRGAPQELARAIEKAQASRTPLLLSVVRDGKKPRTLKVSLPYLPRLQRGYPKSCPSSSHYRKAIHQRLLDLQRPDGSWHKNHAHTTMLAGLALLASGDRRFHPAVQKAAQCMIQRTSAWGSQPTPEKLRTKGPKTWDTCAIGILLAEYHLATGDRSVLRPLRLCCEAMAVRLQPQTGRLGHGHLKLPYSEKGLVIINTQAHLMWALAQRCGVPADEPAWKLSLECVRSALSKKNDGAVGYNHSARSGHQAGARTGSMAAALALVKRENNLRKKMGTWLQDHVAEWPDAHAMSSIGTLYGLAGLRLNRSANFTVGQEASRTALILARLPDGSAAYYGSKGNIGGDSYLSHQVVGNAVAALILSSGGEKLTLFGKSASRPATSPDPPRQESRPTPKKKKKGRS